MGLISFLASIYYSRNFKSSSLYHSGACGGNRTHTLLLILDFESSASTSSATQAYINYNTENRKCKKKDNFTKKII